jgi:hypothetical protein
MDDRDKYIKRRRRRRSFQMLRMKRKTRDRGNKGKGGKTTVLMKGLSNTLAFTVSPICIAVTLYSNFELVQWYIAVSIPIALSRLHGARGSRRRESVKLDREDFVTGPTAAVSRRGDYKISYTGVAISKRWSPEFRNCETGKDQTNQERQHEMKQERFTA